MDGSTSAIIVIPRCNEVAFIDEQASDRFLGENSPCRGLLVEDGSTDSTLSVLLMDLALCTTASRAEAGRSDVSDRDGVVSR